MVKQYLVGAIYFTLSSVFNWVRYFEDCSDWLALISCILITIIGGFFWVKVAREYKYKKEQTMKNIFGNSTLVGEISWTFSTWAWGYLAFSQNSVVFGILAIISFVMAGISWYDVIMQLIKSKKKDSK